MSNYLRFNDDFLGRRPSYGGIRQRNSLKPRVTPSAGQFLKLNIEEEMKLVFRKFDRNIDGKISLEEYKVAAKVLGRGIGDIQKVKAFKAMDSDGDGLIDFKEFVETFNFKDNTIEPEIKKVFEAFDLNGDGRITAEELSQALKKLGESCSLEACRRMVRHVDVDRDGSIDFIEFKLMMLSD
ncbi:hypothetical protein VNO77_40851 [Canavalia gladiata]|uniref:EF-hand domain-containing protein n=1 Tax=Canavalia gladiata TaxID=3824 RepID=A0AAN9K0I9_CANGL